MQEFGSISPLEAFKDLGITRLACRVFELKKQGVEIEKQTETAKNRFGESVHYARYRLV